MRRHRTVALLVAGVCAGCAARYVRVQEKGLSCREAQQLATEAVRRMGYTVTDFTRATPGSPGVIVGTREVGTRKQSMMASVFCSNEGAAIEAKSDTGGIEQLTFASDFRRSLDAAIQNQPPPRAAAESGVDVLLTPQRNGGIAELGVDLGSLGILPVSVRITNRTSRAYRFRADGVALRNGEGQTVEPLPVSQVRQAAGPAAEKVTAHALVQGDIPPQGTLTGMLFFPLQAYEHARVELIDLSSDESEGFAI